MRYYNWSRDRVCRKCGQTFRTMSGTVEQCAVCRNTPEAKSERKERQRRLNTAWQRRDRQRKAREKAA